MLDLGFLLLKYSLKNISILMCLMLIDQVIEIYYKLLLKHPELFPYLEKNLLRIGREKSLSKILNLLIKEGFELPLYLRIEYSRFFRFKGMFEKSLILIILNFLYVRFRANVLIHCRHIIIT